MNITKIKLQRSGLFISNAYFPNLYSNSGRGNGYPSYALDSQRIEQAAPPELEIYPLVGFYKQAAPPELEFIP